MLNKKFMIETEELLRSKGKLKDDQLYAAMRFMESTFLEDLEAGKKVEHDNDGMWKEAGSKRIEELFEKIGETCPFKLANYLGVKLIHRSGLGEIAGLYIKTTPSMHRFFLNANLDTESQENVCFQLVKRRVSHPDMTCAVTSADLKKKSASNALTRIRNAIKSKSSIIGLFH